VVSQAVVAPARGKKVRDRASASLSYFSIVSITVRREGRKILRSGGEDLERHDADAKYIYNTVAQFSS